MGKIRYLMTSRAGSSRHGNEEHVCKLNTSDNDFSFAICSKEKEGKEEDDLELNNATQ